MSLHRILSVAITAVSLLACSSSSSGTSNTVDSGALDASAGDSSAVDSAVADSAGEGSSDASSLAGGSGTVTGTDVDGGPPFGTVATAIFIGHPDNAATTAIYLVNAPLTCAETAASGWSHTIPMGTHIYEMILTTSTPATGSYSVSGATSPPVGSAEVQLIVAQPTRNETRATTGTVTLATLTAGSKAAGTFSVGFVDGSMLQGSFDAVYCADAHEP